MKCRLSFLAVALVALTVTDAATPPTRLIADPNAQTRGAAQTLKGDASDLLVVGYGTNLVLDTANPTKITNVVTLNAFPDDKPPGPPERKYWGHGLYVFHCPATTIDSSAFMWNGYQLGRPLVDKSAFRHGLYIGDPAGSATITGSIFAYNAACGLQTRGTGDVSISGCVFIGNSTGVLTKQKNGTVTIDGCLFIGSDWTLQVDQNGKEVWADANGVTAMSPTVIKNCTFVGLKRPPATDTRKRSTPQWLATGGGAKVDQANNKVVQWAGPGINYDPNPILQDLCNARITVPDAIDKIKTDVAKLLN